MKLLFCEECMDIVKVLPGKGKRLCKCGSSSISSEDGLNVVYTGPSKVLGIDNNKFAAAHRVWNVLDGIPAAGIKFDAFIIPRNAKTIKHE